MLRLSSVALLAVLWTTAIAQQGWTTTVVTITTSPDGKTTVTSSTSDKDVSGGEVLSSKDIELIRQTWDIAKEIPTVATRTLLEHFKTHPKTQELFPKFASVALKDLPKNLAFQKQARSCVVFGLNFIVANLDNPTLLRDMLGRVDTFGKWYVDYMSQDRQMKETVRIFMKVLEEEMGGRLSSEAKSAWNRIMTIAFVEMMATGKPIEASGKSALSPKDVQIVRQSYETKIRDNARIPPKVFLKHFKLHPATQKLFPAFADVPLAQLETNVEFLTQAHTCLKGLFFIVNNLDNDELLTRALAKQTKPAYFVSYMDPIHQLDETTRLFLEAAEEEGALTPQTKAVWKKALDHVHAIMAAHAPFSQDTKRVDRSALSPKQISIIRDTWGLARRDADIAPKVLLKHFELHPETQKMFPRFANVPFKDLMNNKYFLQASYNCFFGLTVIIKNMDEMDLVDHLLVKHASAGFYVAGPSARQQLDETTRITLDIMKEELGEAFNPDAVDAFKALLDHVHQVLAEANKVAPISIDDLSIIRDDWILVKQNKNFGANAIIKFFRAHPATRSLFPKFANVPDSSLPTNPEFRAYGNTLMAALDFMLDNLDDTSVITQMLKGKNWQSYFAPGVSINQQLVETARVFMEAVEEEMGERWTPTTRAAWTNAWAHLNAAQAAAFQ